MRVFILLFAEAASIFCADDLRWGAVKSGLQLGIDVTTTSEPVLRISLKNAGAEPRDLLIGFEGTEDLYNVEITTHAPGEQDQPVFDMTALKASPASLIVPISAHLKPGEVHEFRYPLSQLLCVVNRKDVPFRTLFE